MITEPCTQISSGTWPFSLRKR